MTSKKWFFLYFCLLNTVNVLAQNPIGLRAASFLRGILFGAESSVDNIRRNVDGQYVQKIKDNYQLIVLPRSKDTARIRPRIRTLYLAQKYGP